MFHSVHWFLLTIIYLVSMHSVTPLSEKSTPTYSFTNMENVPSLDSESFHRYQTPQVSRRGYAGDDFYQKASKSIPRMGRRSEPNAKTCFCTPQNLEEIWRNEALAPLVNSEPLSHESIEGARRKRLNLEPSALSDWPWYSDRIPNLPSKRTEVNELCYYSPKYKNFVPNGEICNEYMICCPILNDSSIFKRVLTSRSSKQTTTSVPDYKSNQFM